MFENGVFESVERRFFVSVLLLFRFFRFRLVSFSFFPFPSCFFSVFFVSVLFLFRFRSFFSFDGATVKNLLDFWRRVVYNGIYLDLGIVRFLRRRAFFVL